MVVEVAVADLVAVMGLEGMKTVAALAVVEALVAHHSAATRQPSQTMKKNGIRTKSCFKSDHTKKSQYLKTMVIILLYLSSLHNFCKITYSPSVQIATTTVAPLPATPTCKLPHVIMIMLYMHTHSVM